MDKKSAPNDQNNMRLSFWLFICAFAHLPLISTALAFHTQNSTDLSCFEVSKVPASNQCLFVRQNCNNSSYQIGRADYLKIYYCSPFRKGSLVLVCTGILLFFVSLALTASDYLCPNLYTISKFLQLSDNLAGLTLLALGNGSPDVLSTFKALEVDATGLAVSELMGAALFILTVVVGAISWVHPFKVPKFHFIRDILFYLAVSFICLLILVVGRLSYWSAVLLFSTYLVYVAVVLFSHSVLWENVVKRANISRLRSTYDEEIVSEVSDSSLELFTTDFTPHPSIDSLMVSEYQDERDEFDAFLNTYPHNVRDERALIETGSYGLKLLLKKLSRHSLDLPMISSGMTLTNERPLTASGSAISLDIPTFEQEQTATVSEDNMKTKVKSVWSLLFPGLGPDAPLLSKAHFVVTYPTNSLLRLTTPNREQAIEYIHSVSYNAFNFTESSIDGPLDDGFPDYDYDLDMKLFKIQFVCVPAFVLISCFNNTMYVWLSAPFLVASFYGLSFFIPEADSNLTLKHRFWNYLGSFIGFAASLLWISIFATEIVAILKAMSVIFAISDDMLGATVFALGNSVGDLVSNLIIAKMGMPIMAFGACFGGPLLSISSLGLSAAIIMYKNGTQEIKIEFSNPLKWNCFALILTLIFLVGCVPLNGWMFDKRIGAVLVSIWIISCLLTVISGL